VLARQQRGAVEAARASSEDGATARRAASFGEGGGEGKSVVASPASKPGWRSTLARKARLVATPRQTGAIERLRQLLDRRRRVVAWAISLPSIES
jgi:hypothetical protein